MTDRLRELERAATPGRALIVAPDALQLQADFLDNLPGSLGDDDEIETALAHLVLKAQAEARATAEAQVAELRAAGEAMYRRLTLAHEQGIEDGGHQWWHNLETEWRNLGKALDALALALALTATPASSRFLDLDAPETVERLRQILALNGLAFGAQESVARAIVKRLKEDRREPGDTP